MGSIFSMEPKNKSAPNGFKCYFCNKDIVRETEFGHTSVCAEVLIPCPYKCGSYVARKNYMKHKQECPNKKSKSTNRLSAVLSSGYNSYTLPSTNGRTNGSEIGYTSTEGQTKDPMSKDLQTLKCQTSVFSEWKKSIDLQLDNIKQQITLYEKSKNEESFQWMKLQQQLIALDKMYLDLNILRENFMKEQSYSRESNAELNQKITSLKELFLNQNQTTDEQNNSRNVEQERLKADVLEIHKMISEHKAKLCSIVFDVKAVTQISTEAADKTEIHQRELGKMKADLNQIKIDLEVLEEGSSSLSTNNSTCSEHLMWKITNFETKLQKAKESKSVLKSPIFFSHQFGYKIRMIMYLNGLNKWKDRYALISLHVLKGEYDKLLKWPCFIEGSVILRDVQNPENPKNHSKYITAKREQGDEGTEDPQESSSSYIFIPHTTLKKSTYLQDDTIFIEVKINKNRSLKHETDF